MYMGYSKKGKQNCLTISKTVKTENEIFQVVGILKFKVDSFPIIEFKIFKIVNDKDEIVKYSPYLPSEILQEMINIKNKITEHVNKTLSEYRI